MNILVAKNGSQLGPFSESDIRAKLASGEFAPTDLGWKEGMAAWTPLSGMFADAPAQGPAVPTPYVPPQGQNAPSPYQPQPQGQPYAPQPYNAPQSQYSAPQTYNSPYPSPYQQGPGQQPWGVPGAAGYAGFWLRFVAYIIDAILLAIPSWIVRLVVLGMFNDPYIVSTTLDGKVYGYTWADPVNFLIALAYYGLLESSGLQATVGKLVLGLKVTDLDGNRVSLGRAAGRYVGQIVSWWTLTIGFIMAGFTQRKQALHDIMAGTLVVRK